MNTIDALEVEQADAVKRASTMLRSAKVVCQAGEYICLVRDVSDEGVLLSYLHEAPPEPRIILVLGNGQTHPIQRIWSAEGQASYRFASSVSVEEFLHENAPFQVRPVRLSIAATARLVDGSQSYGARLRDLSTHGACYDCEATLEPHRLVSFQIGGLRPQLGQIIWRDDSGMSEDAARYGLQFQLPLTLRDLAKTSLKLQPFAPVALDIDPEGETASAA